MAKSINRRISEALTGRAGTLQGDTAPGSPNTGDLWYDTNELALYTYYTDDSDVSYWVSTQPSGTLGGSGGGSGVTTYANLTERDAVNNPDEGSLAYITSTDDLYIYNGSSWDRVYAGADDGPQWDSAGSTPPSAIGIDAGDSAYTVYISATDPEGFGITYDVDIAPTNQTRFTVTNNNDGSFEFLPDSANTPNDGDITARFRAHDGLNYISKSTTISLNTFPQKENLVAHYDFRDTACWDGSSTNIYDLSPNDLDISMTLGTGSVSTSIGGTRALSLVSGSTYMSWTSTQLQNVSTIMVVWSLPSDPPVVVFTNSNQNFLGVIGTGNTSTHSGAYDITGLEKMNGTDVNNNRTTALNAMSSSLFNSYSMTGVTGTSSAGFTLNGYGSSFNGTYQLQGIVFWSVDLTADELRKAHNKFSSMATYAV